YERAFSQTAAVLEHKLLEHALRYEFGLEVSRLEDTMIEAIRTNPEIREQIIKTISDSRIYEGKREDIDSAIKEFEDNAKFFDAEFFFNTFMLNPAVDVESESGTRNIHLNVTEREPVANLYFMRDQQYVTDKGIVICRMAKPARRREPKITRFLLETVLGLPILHEIEAPGTMEGGEFMPMGDFALAGIGDRTNREAIDQLLSLGLGYSEIGVVHQAVHPLIPSDEPDPMINMHLDTYFNVASSKVVVGCGDLLAGAKVEVYKNDGNGKFEKTGDDTTLDEYITKKGFTLISITTLEQLCYASNFLCVSDGNILALEVERIVAKVLRNLEIIAGNDPERYGKLLEHAKKEYEELKSEGQFFPHKKEIYLNNINAYPLDLKNLTGGYGGAHCMTCAIERG
ncbi:MAG: amidinotransferase, partial [Actinobacteria bacterium]|nr:amidinotransferase [Actinomycetota bacterium]